MLSAPIRRPTNLRAGKSVRCRSSRKHQPDRLLDPRVGIDLVLLGQSDERPLLVDELERHAPAAVQRAAVGDGLRSEIDEVDEVGPR